MEMFSLNAVADGWLEVGDIQTQGVIAAATILGTTFGEETANSVGQPERFDRISIHSPSYITEFSVESFTLFIWLLNYRLSPADGFAEKFTDVAVIFNLAMLVLNSDCFHLCEENTCLHSILGRRLYKAKIFLLDDSSYWLKSHFAMYLALVSNWWRHVNYG